MNLRPATADKGTAGLTGAVRGLKGRSREDRQSRETVMRRWGIAFLGIAALTALSACGAPQMAGPGTAQARPQVQPVAPPKDRLVAAIEAQDCVLTAENVETILLQARLTQAELKDLTPQLAAEGRAEVAAAGTIRVLTDNCI